MEENILHIFSNLSLAERIEKGKYDRVNGNITARHFPETVSVNYDAEYKLFYFGRNISSGATIKEMEKENFRPANINELLALGETKPKLLPIVELGSFWQRSGGLRSVAVLDYYLTLSCRLTTRSLILGWFGDSWGDLCRFLAVRK